MGINRLETMSVVRLTQSELRRKIIPQLVDCFG
ncbi:hypothetical protein T4B_9906 [Trichinella pseudospiralis]|uniref:Uncharacterized protein n=1 Tax=Trichinella pseudospiralis TaxID=6337 RepID=A0A0V1GM13_TRIPS|nr:hypothetical protein T4B_9906 [Trichinella pseudospiralis]